MEITINISALRGETSHVLQRGQGQFTGKKTKIWDLETLRVSKRFHVSWVRVNKLGKLRPFLHGRVDHPLNFGHINRCCFDPLVGPVCPTIRSSSFFQVNWFERSRNRLGRYNRYGVVSWWTMLEKIERPAATNFTNQHFE
ncbi:hypothetical protein ACFXTI_025405 [Malus domestica]